MMKMNIYPDRTTVSDAINVLRKTGYRTTDISVLGSDNQGSKDFANEKHTKAMEGLAAGAVVGAAVAWLVYVQVVSPVTALGPLTTTGLVLAALAGAAPAERHPEFPKQPLTITFKPEEDGQHGFWVLGEPAKRSGKASVQQLSEYLLKPILASADISREQ